jgi:hypothetical protein
MGTNRDKWGRLPSLSFNDRKQPCWNQGCVLINGGSYMLMRADIPMKHLQTIDGAKFYSTLIAKMMFSRFEHGMTETHLSPFHFVMAMQSSDNLHIYYYKDEYFETMQYLYECYYANNPEWGQYFLEREKQNFPQQLLINGSTSYRQKSHEGIMLQPMTYTFYNHAFEFSRQVRWWPEYHNWNGVDAFDNDKTLAYGCYNFYEKFDDLYTFFDILGVKYTTMKNIVLKMRKLQ